MKKIISKNDFLLIKRALKYVKPFRIRFICLFICVISGIIIGLLQPLIWANIITNLFAKNFNEVLLNIIYVSALFIMQTIIGFIQSFLFSTLNESIIRDLKYDMYKKTLDLPVKAFDDIKVGEFISRLHGDANTVANIITNQLMNSIVDILKVLIIGFLVFNISFPLAIIVLISFPFSLLTYKKFGSKVRTVNKTLAKVNDNYFGAMQQSISGIREIICLGAKINEIKSFYALTDKIKDMNIKINILNVIQQSVVQSISFVSQIAVMGTGGYLIYKDMLSIQFYIAFSSYSSQFSNSLMNITRLNSNIQQALTSLERIFSLMDNFNYTNINYGNKKLNRISGDITFENVNFAYNGNDYVLKNMNFNINHGRKVAIVGASGGGKSSIFNLILRFYEPESGSIKIDNIDIKEIEEDSLRNYIAVVRQDPFLFNTSIKDNLLLANPSATMNEIYEATKAAYIYDFINNLPNGFDTVIEENGINLSGGQKQRIAIARALLKKSKIILFDEATSSLDNESQYNIKRAIYELPAKQTVIIIAHRLFTVIEADEILVIDNGKLVGIGTHNDLINTNEYYKKLYQIELDTVNSKSN